MQVLRYCSCDGQAVVRAGASTDLVQYHQRFWRCVMQDGGGLNHLHHERGLPCSEVVLQPDACEDAVDKTQSSGFRGDKTANLRHERNEGNLADVRRLTRHVRPCQHHQRCAIAAQGDIVGNKGAGGNHAFNHRMSTANDLHCAVVGKRRPHIALS